MISKCRPGGMLIPGKSFLDIPRPYRTRPDVRDGVSESVSRNRGSYYREKYFWIDPRSQSGSTDPRWKETALKRAWWRCTWQNAGSGCERGNSAWMYAADAEVKCNCLAGRHFCNNSVWAVSIVQIRGAIILAEVERNLGLLIKTMSRNSRGCDSVTVGQMKTNK